MPLSRPEAAHLIRLSLAAAAARALTATYDGAGALTIQPTTASQTTGLSAGLTNLARIVATERRDRWPQLVDTHFDHLTSALLQGPPPIPENPEQHLYQRLIPTSAVQPHLTTDAREFVPGLLSVPSTDTNGTITMYFDPSDLGLTWSAAEQAGLHNLRSLTDNVEYADYDGTQVALLSGTPFTASRALVLDTVLRESLHIENPTHGVLAAMPVRDLLLIHVITDLRAIPALAMMLTLATRCHTTEPGPLTPQIYLATPTAWHPATTHPTAPRLSPHFIALTRTLTDPT
ncbi:hypothetical protein [Kribbella sancticallisti]